MDAGCSSQCWLWNGERMREADSVPLSDRGFRYGMAVFESVRIFHGRPEFLTAHLWRLERAASRAGLPVPPTLVRAAVEPLYQMGAATGMARLYLTAGDGAPADPVLAGRIALLFETRTPALPKSYALLSSPEPHLPPFGGLKTANYWANAERLRCARSEGADEALLFTPDGFLTGACMANTFLHTPSGWVTPGTESGARDGVVRASVLQRLKARRGPVQRAMLTQVDAAFLTSSWLGIMPVHSLEGRSLAIPQEVLALGSLSLLAEEAGDGTLEDCTHP